MSEASNRIHTFFVLKQPGEPDSVVVWDTQDISLGRSRENDLAIDHVEISRRHAQFNCTGRNHVVRNLNTSNGTLVNGEEISTHVLQSGDVIRIAELELTFYQSTRDPIALGRPLQYASQLKEFSGPSISAQDGDATMLGLVDMLSGSNEAFEVRPANDFAYDLHGLENETGHTSAPRDLDLELEGFGLDDVEIPEEVLQPPQAPAAGGTPQFIEFDDVEETPSSVSLHIEIQGLQGELRQLLRTLAGKRIELPALKICIVEDDLD
jgi:hypothetical protein